MTNEKTKYYVRRYKAGKQKWVTIYMGSEQKKAQEVYEDYTTYSKKKSEPSFRLFQGKEIISEY